MSWGYRIVLVLALFVIGMSFMVYIAMRQSVEMVDSNYYEKELKYQNIIDAKNNLAALGDSVLVIGSDSTVAVHMPQGAVKDMKGYLEFLRPSDKTKDTTFIIRTNEQGVQYLDRGAFVKGYYRLRAGWKSNGKDYYDERNVLIP
ncbi:MAG: FixH family protein [Niabella sp.]